MKCRHLNGQELQECETVLYESDKKTSIFTLTVSGDITGMSGQVRVHAKNGGGEDEATCELTVNGRFPTFIEKPLKCTILEGMQIF